MNRNLVTADLNEFGYMELIEASKLLKSFAESDIRIDSDGLTLNFNKNSGFVFLSDENYDVWMMNGDKLEQWYSCPICGHEGFKEDMTHNEDNPECQEYLKDIGVKK